MVQLLKVRTFSDYISDVFQFLKLYGKHYFKNYLKFAFISLLISSLTIVIISIFSSQIFSSLKSIIGIEENFVGKNTLLVIFTLLILYIVASYFIILSLAFPLYYMKLISENPNVKPQLQTIRSLFRNDLKRMLRFGFLSVILYFIAALFFLLAALYLVGSFIAFLLVPALFLLGLLFITIIIILIQFLIIWYIVTFFYYGNDNLPFFSAAKKAYKKYIKDFWKIIGANICMIIIVSTLDRILTAIPVMLFKSSLGITNLDFAILNPSVSISQKVIIALMFCFSFLVSLLLYHLILIQNNLVYYSQQKQSHNIYGTDQQ